MCLAYPAKLVEIRGDQGVVELAGNRYEVNLVLVPTARIGEYVLVHAGYAIQVVEPDTAEETWGILSEIHRSLAADDAAEKP
jgi:hydrogenase expression/formation protein HypC